MDIQTEVKEEISEENEETTEVKDEIIESEETIKEEAPDDSEDMFEVLQNSSLNIKIENNLENDENINDDHISGIPMDDIALKSENEESEYVEQQEDLEVKTEPELESTDEEIKIPNLLHNELFDEDDYSEQILPNDYLENDNIREYQLNSITSDAMSLEQEAYSLYQRDHDITSSEYIQCIKCTSIVKKSNFLRHSQAHKAILKNVKSLENNKSGASGVNHQCSKCCKKYTLKKSMLKHQRYCKVGDSIADDFRCTVCGQLFTHRRSYIMHQDNCKPQESPHNVTNIEMNMESGEYSCSCGKSFQRRSRMETCLRSHNTSEQFHYQGCHKCTSCGKQFQNKNDLTTHRKLHIRKRYPCKFCPLDFHTPKQLFKHLRKHQKVQQIEYEVVSAVVNGKQKLKCFMCNKNCNELSELKLHVLGDHKQPYTCPKCQENFRNIIDFASHTKNMHPEIEGQSVLSVIEAFSKLARCWKCQECGVQFDQPKKLALHQVEQHTMNSKSEMPEFLCRFCSRVFLTAKRLASHCRMIHEQQDGNGAEVYINPILMCIHCRKVCKDENALACHMRLHSPERKFVCKFCDFRFATFEKRKAHLPIHTGDMKYVCFICDYVCTSENRLTMHKQSDKHLKMKEHLLNNRSVIREVASSEKSADEPSVCNVCGDEFSNEFAMLQHKKIHPFIEFPHDPQPSKIFFK